MQEEALPRARATTVFARILVHCPSSTVPLFERAYTEGVRTAPTGATYATVPATSSASALLLQFASSWAEVFDAVAQPVDRKLCAMAFASLLTLPVPGVLDLFSVLMAHVTGVYLALEESGVDGGEEFGGEMYSVLLNVRPDWAASSGEDPSLTISEDAVGVLLSPSSLYLSYTGG
jgi:hypothetical protein